MKYSLCEQPVFGAEGFPQRVVFGKFIQPPADVTTTTEEGTERQRKRQVGIL